MPLFAFSARGRPATNPAFAQALADVLNERARDIARQDFARALWCGGGDPAALSAHKHIASLTVRDACVDGANEIFPFAAGSLDLIIVNGGLGRINDVPGVLAQMRRALAPDGLFLAAFAGGETLMELRSCLPRVEIARSGGASARVHPMIDLQALAALMQRAGFALPVVDSDTRIVHYRRLRTLLRDIKEAGESLALAGRPRYAGKGFWEALETEYRASFADADGLLPARFEILCAIGWGPCESQQKPLAPGSASHKMADFL